MPDEAKQAQTEAPPGAAKVPAFPEGEAAFPESPSFAGPADLGHWVLQGLLWGLIVICGGAVLIGCVRILSQIGQYYG